MESLLFWFFTFGMLLGGIGVIANRNPIASALSLVISICFLAGLYLLLNAFFLAAIQIIVYAGAVMVLFLFIVMLLDLRAEAKRPFRWGAFFVGLVVAVLFFVAIARVTHSMKDRFVAAPFGNPDNITAIGNLLFTRYLLPFEVTSILLLVAMIGAILLSKKELK